MTNTYDNISENMFTALTMLDLKKAFDIVSHDILLLKLCNYGIRGIVNNYYFFYLKDRYQFLSCDNIVSDKLPITYGVPQGSVLGPLLFLLYINDLNNCTSTPPTLFADDTCILLADHDSNNLHAKISFKINNINKWMISNKLTLNLSKSNLIIIPPKKLLPEKYILSLDFSQITLCKTVKYLGVSIDDSLNFDAHIFLENKLARSLGILFKTKQHLNTSTLVQIYYSTFHAYLSYGLIIWGSTFKSYLNCLRDKIRL